MDNNRSLGQIYISNDSTTYIYDVRDVYDMIYNDNTLTGHHLGTFYVIKQIKRDLEQGVDEFIGMEIDSEKICYITSTPFTRYGGGVGYQLISLDELCLKSYRIL